MPDYTSQTAADVSLTAATAKTVLQIVTGATRRALVKKIELSFNSVTATDAPVLVELRKQSTAGTSSANTPIPVEDGETAAICTARDTFTAEPTDVSLHVPGPWRITPVGGTFVYEFPTGRELKIAINSRLGLRLTAAQNQSGVRATLTFGE